MKTVMKTCQRVTGLPTCVLEQSSVLFSVFCLVQQQLKVSSRNVSTKENQLRKV